MKYKIIDLIYWPLDRLDIGWIYYGAHKLPTSFYFGKNGGFCWRHRIKLTPNYEWYTWECRKCREKAGRW